MQIGIALQPVRWLSCKIPDGKYDVGTVVFLPMSTCCHGRGERSCRERQLLWRIVLHLMMGGRIIRNKCNPSPFPAHSGLMWGMVDGEAGKSFGRRGGHISEALTF